jgi:hypothetical protein
MGVKAPTYPHASISDPYAAFLPDVLHGAEDVRLDGPGDYSVSGDGAAWVVSECLEEAFRDFLAIELERTWQPQPLPNDEIERWHQAGEIAAGPFNQRDISRYLRKLGAFGRLQPHASCPVPPLRADQHQLSTFVARWGPLTPSRPDQRQTEWDHEFTSPLNDIRRIVGRDSPLTLQHRLQLAISMLRTIPEDTLLIALTYAALSELSAGHLNWRPCAGCSRWFNEPEYDPNDHPMSGRVQTAHSHARYHSPKCRKAAGERRRRQRRKAELAG